MSRRRMNDLRGLAVTRLIINSMSRDRGCNHTMTAWTVVVVVIGECND